jgi:hypothetical protein
MSRASVIFEDGPDGEMLVYADIPDATPAGHWAARAAQAVAAVIHAGESIICLDMPVRMSEDGQAVLIFCKPQREAGHG